MVVKLYQDYLWQDITQWQNLEPEKLEEKPESESTEDDEKNE
jgi:hypothetical protein